MVLPYPNKLWGDFFRKKAFHEGSNFLGQIYGKVILNGRINDQIMSRWRRSFINDKCILQQSEHCKSSLELSPLKSSPFDRIIKVNI